LNLKLTRCIVRKLKLNITIKGGILKMERVWSLKVWTGKRYEEANCGDCKFLANGPRQAIKKAGLDDPMYTIKMSRRGYDYFTGRVFVYAPETIAAGEHVPADFIIEVDQ
jgi:hypothetical protein